MIKVKKLKVRGKKMNRTKQLQELKRNLEIAVANHDRLKNSYFWTPGSHASSRRSNESRNNFAYENDRYGISVENSYSESCKNVYYKGIFYVDGKKTTVTKIKNIINALDTVC